MPEESEAEYNMEPHATMQNLRTNNFGQPTKTLETGYFPLSVGDKPSKFAQDASVTGKLQNIINDWKS
jgi:hypothetical protein